MAPPIASPAVSTKTASDVPPTRASTPRREMVGAAGWGADEGAVDRLGPAVPASLPVRQFGPEGPTPGPEARPDHVAQLHAHVDAESGDERPRPVEVAGIEVDLGEVVDVQDAGGHLEDDPADDEDQAHPLEELGHRSPRWPVEQLGHDRPQFGQDDRYQYQAEHDVHPFEGPGTARLGFVTQSKRYSPKSPFCHNSEDCPAWGRRRHRKGAR